jgi:hypothetical protein
MAENRLKPEEKSLLRQPVKIKRFDRSKKTLHNLTSSLMKSLTRVKQAISTAL